MSKLGTYDHLNKDTPLRIPCGDQVEIRVLNMEALVLSIRESNYGVHRFLSELVRQEKKSCAESGQPISSLMTTIEEHLNRGEYR